MQVNKSVSYINGKCREPFRGFLIGECPAYKDVHEKIKELMDGWNWVAISSMKSCSPVPRAIVACLDNEGGWLIRTTQAYIDMEEVGDATSLIDYFADWIASDSLRLGEWVNDLAENELSARPVRTLVPKGLYYAILGRAQRRMVALETSLSFMSKNAKLAICSLKALNDTIQLMSK